MSSTPVHRASVVSMLCASFLLGSCGGSPQWSGVAEPDAGQLATAEKARDQLAATLLQELQAALAEGGPTQGIAVCSERAPEIAREVGQAAGVAIGRTSARLRNPANTAPEWAREIVGAPVPGAGPAAGSEPRFFAHGDGRFGALFPIVLGPACVQCHGTEAQIAAETRRAIAQHYPEDRATGFTPGDLRGWFWVEVPNGP